MSFAATSFREITRVDRSAFSLPAGLRGGAFVSAPLLLGVVTGQQELVYVTLGALFLTNTEGPRSVSAPLRVLFVACFVEALAFGLGTLAGTTGLVAIPLMMVGVFLPLMFGAYPRWALVAMFTAIFFAVGVGLPGGSVGASGSRLVFSLVGSFWGFAGVALHRFIARPRATGVTVGSASAGSTNSGSGAPHLGGPWAQPEAFKHAVIVGVASGVGISIGLALGLPRDFWVVVTIILAVRPNINATVSFTSMIVLGTVVGATMAAFVTLGITNDYLLWTLLFLFSVGQFATRGMNLGLTQVFNTPFLIILLNILYPGEWQLAEVRILDVVIGGAIAVLTVYLLGIKRKQQPAAPLTQGVPPATPGTGRSVGRRLRRRSSRCFSQMKTA
ncbi:MAG: FUSC family protein [Thaumarchaeota archaeon]|nr:FUSC family protein [Nitrososphaerota archaeon]